MHRNTLKAPLLAARAVVLALAFGFAVAPVSAKKPSWAGADTEGKPTSSAQHEHGKKAKKAKDKSKKAKDKSKKTRHGKHFSGQDEDVVRDYYRKDCPPGLAKKNNACMPPGQAKKQWATGEPLPGNVVYHDLPHQLLSKLPVPPDGQRYVRVLTDILLVGINTDIVIDAIVDVAIP